MELTRSGRLQNRTAELVGGGNWQGFFEPATNLKNVLGMEVSRQTLEEIISKNSEDMVRRLLDDNPLPYSAPPDFPSQTFFFGEEPTKALSSRSSCSSSSGGGSTGAFTREVTKGYTRPLDLSSGEFVTGTFFVSDSNGKFEEKKLPSSSQLQQSNHFQYNKKCGIVVNGKAAQNVDGKLGKSAQNGCNYCRATQNPYKDHTKFNCPALASLAPCRLCKASGPYNHTITYCPMKRKVILKKKTSAYSQSNL